MSSLQPPLVAGERPTAIYNQRFWLAYTANVLLVTANALTFRFAEFVKWMGGNEALTGQIVSIGIIGSLFARFTLGHDIDRFGVRRMWLTSSVLFVIGCGLLTVTQHLGWQIYAARLAFTVGLASMFACSISHIQAQVPTERRTEVLGSLGSSGFVGMIIGAQLGDRLFAWIPPGRPLFMALFGTACLCGIGYLVAVYFITRNDRHDRPHETPHAHKLIFRFWPGPVVLVALMMGVGFVVTTVFLTRHATVLGLPGIGTFFTVYPASAFLVRVMSRGWSRTIGRHRMILMGLAGHCLGHLLLCSVRHEWDLILPAIGCGFGHALLFPCVVSLGAGAFPPEYRGTGTTITLGFMDLGVFLSAPVLGWVIDAYGFNAMFLASAGTGFVIAVVYAVETWGVVDTDSDSVKLARPIVDTAAGLSRVMDVPGVESCEPCVVGAEERR